MILKRNQYRKNRNLKIIMCFIRDTIIKPQPERKQLIPLKFYT